MSPAQKINVLIWKVSSAYVKDHPYHNPHGLRYTQEAPPVYAHTRQIDWSSMHKDIKDAQPANDS